MNIKFWLLKKLISKMHSTAKLIKIFFNVFCNHVMFIYSVPKKMIFSIMSKWYHLKILHKVRTSAPSHLMQINTISNSTKNIKIRWFFRNYSRITAFSFLETPWNHILALPIWQIEKLIPRVLSDFVYWISDR